MLNALILAALSVVPVYTNHNRVAGNVQTMTNIQAWADAVETAIGQGGGGSSMNTNIVSDIADSRITNSVLVGYLAQPSVTNGLITVEAAQAMTNDLRTLTDMSVWGKGYVTNGPWTVYAESQELADAIRQTGQIPVWNGEYWELPHVEGAEIQNPTDVENQYDSPGVGGSYGNYGEGTDVHAWFIRPLVDIKMSDRLATTNQLETVRTNVYTKSETDQHIATATADKITAVDATNLVTSVAYKKQDKLTAGEGIEIAQMTNGNYRWSGIVSRYDWFSTPSVVYTKERSNYTEYVYLDETCMNRFFIRDDPGRPVSVSNGPYEPSFYLYDEGSTIAYGYGERGVPVTNTVIASTISTNGFITAGTTLEHYGIADAKIENGTITLGANTITPITVAQVQANWTETDTASKAYIQNKPTLKGFTTNDTVKIAASDIAAGVIPTTLPNPNSLTFTGAASGSYDGSASKTVNIPAAVTDAHITELADASVAPTSNVVFNTETYFALNDGDLELVSESNLVFQGVYELTNYTDAANVTIYHGQIASQTLTNQSLLNITLKFPTGAQKAGDAMLRVVSTLAATATVVCVEGATTAHLAGVKDWGIFDAGSTNLLSFTKVAMENGDWEIWVGKAKSEL